MSKKKNCSLTVQDLLEIIEHGELKGEINNALTGIATLKSATPNDITFYHNNNYKKDLAITKAGVVILAEKDAKYCTRPMICHQNPHLAFNKALAFFVNKNEKRASIHSSVVIGSGCNIASDAYIGPNVVIGDNVSIGAGTQILANSYIADNVTIGINCEIHNNVTICQDTIIGDGSIFHSGCRIGTDGFGFSQNSDVWYKFYQLGRVIIGRDVDIGANTTIDCGSLDDTVIGNGVKIDNQVHIGHNCVIGDNSIIAGCTGIAGSTIVGKNCMIGGGCNINGHIEIGDGVILMGSTSVRKSLYTPDIYSSLLVDAFNFKENLKLGAKLKKFYQKAESHE